MLNNVLYLCIEGQHRLHWVTVGRQVLAMSEHTNGKTLVTSAEEVSAVSNPVGQGSDPEMTHVVVRCGQAIDHLVHPSKRDFAGYDWLVTRTARCRGCPAKWPVF